MVCGFGDSAPHIIILVASNHQDLQTTAFFGHFQTGEPEAVTEFLAPSYGVNTP